MAFLNRQSRHETDHRRSRRMYQQSGLQTFCNQSFTDPGDTSTPMSSPFIQSVVANGCPPYVPPWSPGANEQRSSLTMSALSGNHPPIPLAMAVSASRCFVVFSIGQSHHENSHDPQLLLFLRQLQLHDILRPIREKRFCKYYSVFLIVGSADSLARMYRRTGC